MALPSKLEQLVLRQLISGGESYGLALVKASDGALKRGTVYVTLNRMQEKGLVTSRQEDVTPEHIGIPRRLYKVTGLGARSLAAVEHSDAILAGKAVPA
jgi:PadR family transcriptional regulator, regulatory protein PadR